MKPKSIAVFVEETNINHYGWQIIIEGFFLGELLSEYIPFRPATQFSHIREDHGWSGIDVESFRKMGEYVLEKLSRRKIPLQKLLKQHYELGQQIYDLYEKMDGKNLEAISAREFIVWFEKLWHRYLELNALGMVPVVSDYYHSLLSTKLGSIMNLRDIPPAKRQEYLNVLMSPDIPSYMWREQLEFMQIASKHSNLAKLEKSRDFVNHLKKYEWLNYGYQGPQIKLEDFLARAKNFTKIE